MLRIYSSICDEFSAIQRFNSIPENSPANNIDMKYGYLNECFGILGIFCCSFFFLFRITTPMFISYHFKHL